VRVVLDCSVALTWCLPGQGTSAADRLLEHIRLEGGLVPRIWHLEVSNIMGLKLRDGNLSGAAAQQGLGLLNTLDIVTDTQLPPINIAKSIGNIIRFQLAAYDALYLELALRAGLPLATFDKAMIASARRYGISILGGE
jgi:predicted nucleic acid-binding protein